MFLMEFPSAVEETLIIQREARSSNDMSNSVGDHQMEANAQTELRILIAWCKHLSKHYIIG